MTEGDNTHKNFRGQLATEELLAFCRKHWVIILPHIVGFIVFAVIVTATLAFFPEKLIDQFLSVMTYRVISLLLVAFCTYYLHNLFIRFFNYYLRILIITNYRVVDLDKTVFFRDYRDTIDLSQIQDCVMYQRGILQTVFNYGEIHIQLSGVAGEKVVSYIPNPDYHFRKINKTKREYILKRQFDKTQIQERPASGLQRPDLTDSGVSIPQN